jgi:hypothetical protein
MSDTVDTVNISAEGLEEFVGLASRLSPENLSCDGEASRSYINQKLREIRKEWKALEKKYGVRLTEDEVWAMYLGLTIT